MHSQASYAISHVINDSALQLAVVKLERKIALISEMIGLAIELIANRERQISYDKQYARCSDIPSTHIINLEQLKGQSEHAVLDGKFAVLKDIFSRRYGSLFTSTNTSAASEKGSEWLQALQKILQESDEALREMLATIEKPLIDKKLMPREEKFQDFRNEGEPEPGEPAFEGVIAVQPEKSQHKLAIPAPSSLSIKARSKYLASGFSFVKLLTTHMTGSITPLFGKKHARPTLL